MLVFSLAASFCWEGPGGETMCSDAMLCTYRIKHRVQNPRRVTKPEPIASTHAQMGPRIAHLLVGVSIASIESNSD